MMERSSNESQSDLDVEDGSEENSSSEVVHPTFKLPFDSMKIRKGRKTKAKLPIVRRKKEMSKLECVNKVEAWRPLIG